jgi:hypothetical protein
MGSLADLLGATLVAHSDSKVKRFETLRTAEALAGKHVGLFFAASWRVQRVRSTLRRV